MNIVFVSEQDLAEDQKRQIEELGKECFSDVNSAEVEEDFVAESSGRLFAVEGEEIIGMLELFKRVVKFEDEEIILGGMGGVCVTENMRGQGIATKLLQKGLEILKKQNCEIACLNVNREKQAYKLYEKLGFEFLNRNISYEDVNGKIKYDGDSMFIPINSQEKYEKVMNSKAVFHQGRGYW